MQRRSEPFHSAVALWRPAQSVAVAESVSLKEAAERVGVSSATLRRWAREGVISEVDGTGEWTTAAVAHARIVARLRERGHKLVQIKKAGREGRLAYGYIEEMFGADEPTITLKDAAELTDLEPALIERFFQHFVEQDVVGHMESELDDEQIALGRVRMAIAFADLTGYTRFTEEEG